MATWQVQQAKSRLSELMEDAWSKGPQIITKHGTKNVAVISIDDYDSFMSSRVQPKDTAKEYLLSGPKFEDGENPFENLRDPNDFGRDFEF